jgi:hypothetical protein
MPWPSNDLTDGGLVGLLFVLGVRLIDWVLPRGRHWRRADHYSTPDDPPEEDT